MSTFYLIFLFSNFILVKCKIESFDDELLPQRNFVYWPNATVPFYINSDHFDAEQSLSILSSLSLFAFKTCLKFAPVMAEPVNHHVLLIENPNGRRKCDVNNEAHSFEEPHRLTLGYECLKSPDIDMMIMRALGFPFEHNRASRDVFIDVQFENIESARRGQKNDRHCFANLSLGVQGYRDTYEKYIWAKRRLMEMRSVLGSKRMPVFGK
ncbi:unnamed protein product [Pieris macdunnoughi]|uniref:Peptidase M12A domain-containing protein n=1 Tax=Pieris macdunnoughi TaxID=345717 RepID=A0A821W6R3_9NEOP|nr:unnamed protein product [Pieris macdunnoughi]